MENGCVLKFCEDEKLYLILGYGTNYYVGWSEIRFGGEDLGRSN